MRSRRSEALEAELAGVVQGRISLSPDSLSQVLLYGFDHDRVSPDWVSAALPSLTSSKIVLARFAARLIGAGSADLWMQLWANDLPQMRELLLLAAVDELGTRIDLPGFGADTNRDPRLRRAWEFLIAWDGLAPQPSEARSPSFPPAASIAALPVNAACVVGFSASGKSTLARGLVDAGHEVVDADRLAIEGDEDDLRRFFLEYGAGVARQRIWEKLAGSGYLSMDGGAVFLGSSTTSLPVGRRSLLDSSGLTVRLLASPAETVRRLRQTPSHAIAQFVGTDYGALQISRLQEIRNDNYYFADVTVRTDYLSEEQAVAQLGLLLGHTA